MDDNKERNPQGELIETPAGTGIVEAAKEAACETGAQPPATQPFTSGDGTSGGDAAEKEISPAKNSDFKEKVWNPILFPIVALVAICLVTSLLLGLTNSLTQPLIAANTEAVAAEARRSLLPEADSFTAMETAGLPDTVTAMYAADNGTGYVVESWGRGYGGQVPAMVAFDAEGTVVGVTFLENSETPGLGRNIVGNAAFAGQFANRPAQTIGLGEVDKIASATISTGAAVNAVNAAIDAYNAEVRGEVAAATPEEVRAALLPGEVLSPVLVPNLENVQPEAFVSDAGHYIIYGEKPSEREGSDSVVVTAVAMDENGTVLNLWIDTSGESEQYGQTLAQNRPFLDSFIGQSAPAEVDVVADISNSSRSVMQAVNTALDALPMVKEAANG